MSGKRMDLHESTDQIFRNEPTNFLSGIIDAYYAHVPTLLKLKLKLNSVRQGIRW